MGVKRYETPAAFKAALESRLIRRARELERPVNRARTMLVMERFLVRASDVLPTSALLKGGLALELRLERARTTRDIDLRFMGSADDTTGLLEQVAATVLQPDDHLRFTISPDPKHPTIEGEGIVYQGLRYRVRCSLAARPYGDPFGVDVAHGDIVHGNAPEVEVGAALAFAGIPPSVVRVYPLEAHIAEKLHAYSLPRARLNSRVRDLPDVALIATQPGLAASAIRDAIDATFTFRGTHPIPQALPAPPSAWAARYLRIAEDERLPWRDLPDLLAAVKGFLDPVLASEGSATWCPETWSWRRTSDQSRDGGKASAS